MHYKKICLITIVTIWIFILGGFITDILDINNAYSLPFTILLSFWFGKQVVNDETD